MAHPLTDFLISLLHEETFQKYSHAKEDERKKMMHDAGLSPTQSDVVLSEDPLQIVNAVNEELHPRAHHKGARIIHLQIDVGLPQTDR